MSSPPFRFSGIALAGVPITDVIGEALLAPCCQPQEAQAHQGTRRARLNELNSHLHCSVIGTCLSTAELRKLVPRFTTLDRARASDLELHHAAVELAAEGGPGAKALHKALDERYDMAVKRFHRIKNAEELLPCWEEFLKLGDVPGAYWALMTHPHVSAELRQIAFGEVHMLSHLVGSANRADIRRLLALEQENTELSEKLERQQQRMLEVNAERQSLATQLAEQAAEQLRRNDRKPADMFGELNAQVQALRSELDAKEQALAHHTSRRETAEAQMLEARNAAQASQEHLEKTFTLVESLQAELQAVEQQLAARLEPATAHDPSAALLRDKRVVYVGGRPSSNQTIKSMVGAAGGDLTVHDGGIEDRKGLLAAAIPRADMVVFPVDCIDHDSMSTVKKICEKHQIPFYPVRSASAASFSSLLARLSTQAADAGASPVSRFCLRHG